MSAGIRERHHLTPPKGLELRRLRAPGGPRAVAAPVSFGLSAAPVAGLVRVSGMAYQFRHRELQDHLAAR